MRCCIRNQRSHVETSKNICAELFIYFIFTVMILIFRTDRSEQTAQTQIRLLLDKGLHCLPFHLHLLDTLLYGINFLFEFRGITSNFSGVRKFRNFTVFVCFMLLIFVERCPIKNASVFFFQMR